MKSFTFCLLVVVAICFTVYGADAASACGVRACNGPVREVWALSDKCDGNPSSTATLNSNMVKGGDCFASGSGSMKVNCGMQYMARTYTTPDCSGPYSIVTVPTDKCIVGQGSAYKIQCASANSVAFSLGALLLTILVPLLLV